MKEQTNAILQKVFANTVAALCSWKGRNENFAVGNTKIIACIKGKRLSNNLINYSKSYCFCEFFLEYVCHGTANSNATEAEFKNIAMDFFRFGRQRLQRENAKIKD